AEVLYLGHPVHEHLTLLVRRLLVRFVRRHVMGLHIRERLLPLFAEVGVTGVLERGLITDLAFLFLRAVAVRAIGGEEGGDFVSKGLFRVGLKRGEIRVPSRRRRTRPRKP